MVSIEQTAKKYHGRKAETYDAVRTKQQRWTLENEAVERMLTALQPRSVLDCPVGTGRYLRLYHGLRVQEVIGVDASREMLRLAARKNSKLTKLRGCVCRLEEGDAREHDCADNRVDVAVCVRFLDLIDEAAMRRVMAELMRVARRAVVLTIRWGENYVPKVNTATHDRNAFKRLIKRHGWGIEETVPIFEAGWVVLRLGRR